MWQRTRNPLDKALLNRLTHQLSTTLQQVRNDSFEYYITNLTPDDTSLWRATKSFKRPTTQYHQQGNLTKIGHSLTPKRRTFPPNILQMSSHPMKMAT